MNTLGFESRAAHYAEAEDEAALVALLDHAERHDWPLLVLGGGSNVVLTGDVPGLTVRLVARRIDVIAPPGQEHALVRAEAGVGWDELVRETLARGLPGLENLSLIPGTVGAAPVQNIGAYGVELAERLHSLRAWHRPSRRWREMAAAECGFGYRDSLFKRERGDWIIGSVTFALGPRRPVVASYASLAAELDRRGIARPTHADVAEAVVATRRARLPDPAAIGNVGSFFHNPLVSAEQAERLARSHPGIVRFPQPDGRVKLAAGWLIEQLGLRGRHVDGIGVYERQALILTNEGEGDAAALMRLVEHIVTRVASRYGVTLTPEPHIV